MRIKIFPLLLTASLCTTAIYTNIYSPTADAKAKPLPAVDAAEFDVSGVRIGMSRQEAVTAVIQKFSINESALKFEAFPRRNDITNTEEPAYFSVHHNTSDLKVSFAPKVPYDPKRPMIVSDVTYNILWTAKNVKIMKDQVLKKYGNPSYQDSGFYYWCLLPKRSDGCASDKGVVLKYNESSLHLSGSKDSEKPLF